MAAATDLFYRLTSTSWGAGLFMGFTFGAYMAIRSGLDTGSPAVGLVGGFVSGLLLGVIMAVVAHRQRGLLRHLPTTDRVLVLRSVRRGEDVGEPRLAPAVIAYAEQLRRQSERFWGRPSTEVGLCWGFALLGVLVTAGAAVEGNTAGMIGSSALTLIWAGSAVAWPRRHARTMARIDKAERAAEALLRPPANERRPWMQGPWS